MNKKVRLLLEVGLFIVVLGVITFSYYFKGNNKNEGEEQDTAILKVTDQNFEEVVMNSDKTVVLEFSSNMCPPCLTMIPTLINLAKNEDIKVVTMNTSDDESKATAEKYEVDATPTILIIKNAQVVKTFLGATNEETIMKAVNGEE